MIQGGETKNAYGRHPSEATPFVSSFPQSQLDVPYPMDVPYPSSWGLGLLIIQAGTCPTASITPEAGDASLQALEKAEGGGGRGMHIRLQGSTSTWSFQFKPSIGMTHGN